MLVKRTKKGKLSIALDLHEREEIFGALVNFLEGESMKLMTIGFTKEPEMFRHLYYSILNEMLVRIDFNLLSAASSKINLNRSEGIALMWLLRYYDHRQSMLQLKAGLHKQLHS